MSDVIPARGVLLSESAAREVAAALDVLARLAAPRGQQLSQRLEVIRRELSSSARGGTHGGVSAEGVAGQAVTELEVSVVDTATAAQVLGITPSGVTWMCRRGHLRATRQGGRWLIDTAGLRAHQLLRKER